MVLPFRQLQELCIKNNEILHFLNYNNNLQGKFEIAVVFGRESLVGFGMLIIHMCNLPLNWNDVVLSIITLLTLHLQC